MELFFHYGSGGIRKGFGFKFLTGLTRFGEEALDLGGKGIDQDILVRLG